MSNEVEQMLTAASSFSRPNVVGRVADTPHRAANKFAG